MINVFWKSARLCTKIDFDRLESLFRYSLVKISSDIILICPHRHSRPLTCERNDASLILRSWTNRKLFLPERLIYRRIAVRHFHSALARLISSDYAVRTLSAPYFRSARFILRLWRTSCCRVKSIS